MSLLLNWLSSLFCPSASIIMAVMAIKPMLILIQSVALTRSDAFKKFWSGVVETKD